MASQFSLDTDCSATSELPVESYLSEILATSEAAENPNANSPAIHGIVVGRVVAATESGDVLIEYPGNPDRQPQPARSTVALNMADLDQPVVVMFEQGDPRRPIILGTVIPSPAQAIANSANQSGELNKVRADQSRLVLSAKREVVLQCGEASITLTAAGKVLIRGAYVSSRSSGVNRVKGASVQIN